MHTQRTHPKCFNLLRHHIHDKKQIIRIITTTTYLQCSRCLPAATIWSLQSNWFFFSFTEEFQSCEPKMINKDPYSIFKESIWIIRVPDKLWNEVHDIVQETGIKTIPVEKKCKKAKWLSGEALQIAVKRREAKSKGEKESYKHLNAEFQRIARRDKKAFLSDQCKEIEENNRLGD